MPSTAKLLLEVSETGTDATKAKVSDLNEHVNKTQSFFKNAIGSAAGFVGATVIMGGVSLAAGFLQGQVGGVVDAFRESQRVAAQTNAVLASTQGISGMTADSVGKLATKLSDLTGIDDETVQSAENMLLTFTNIHSETFPAATQAALDMAKALGQDTSQSAMMLGKALNDPIQGVAALRRDGVQLSDAQEEQVKHFMAINDVASAQKIILGEVSKEFGGSAAAQGTAADKLGVKLDNLKELIGGAVVPIYDKLATAITPVVSALGDALPGAIDKVSGFLASNLGPVLGNIGTFVSSFGDKLSALATFIVTNVVPAAMQLAQWFGTNVMPVLLAIGTVIVTQVVPALEQVFTSIATNLVPTIENLWNLLAPKLVPIFQMVGTILQNVVAPAVSGLINLISGLITWVTQNQIVLDALKAVLIAVAIPLAAIGIAILATLVPAFISWAIAAGGAAIAQALLFAPIILIVGAIALLVLGIIELVTHWQQVVDFLGFVAGKIGEFVGFVLGKFGDFFGWLFGKIGDMLGWFGDLPGKIGAALGNVFAKIGEFKDNVINKLGELKDAAFAKMVEVANNIMDALGSLPGKLLQLGKDLITNIVNGIQSMAGNVGGAVKNVVNNIPGIGGIANWAGFASGTPSAPGGLSRLAENGMELVTAPTVRNLPRGAHVYNNAETMDILAGAAQSSRGGGNTINVYPAQSSLTAEGLATIQRRVAVLYG